MDAALKTLQCYGQVDVQHHQGVARFSQQHHLPLAFPEQIRLVVWEQKWGSVVQVTIHHALMDGFSIVLMVRQFKQLLQGQTLTPYPQVRKEAHPSPVLKQPLRQHIKLLKLADGRRLRPIVAALFSMWLKDHFPKSHWTCGRLAHGRTSEERRSIGVFCRIDTPEGSPWVRSILNELPEFDFSVPGSSRILIPWLNPLAEVELQSTLRADTLYLTFRVDADLMDRETFERTVLAFRTELQQEEQPSLSPALSPPIAPALSLKEALQKHANLQPDGVALETPEGQWTYRQLWDHLQHAHPVAGFRQVDHVLDALVQLHHGQGYHFGAAQVPPCDDPCCVVYTSGTTGPQKPIRLKKTAVETYLAALSSKVHIQPGDRVLQAHAWTFDGHLENLFLALLQGATLVVPEQSALQFSAWDHIQHASVPTALFHHWAREKHFPASLKTVIVGGEPLQPAALACKPETLRLINTYGPAEATISVTLSEDHSLGQPIDPEHLQLVDPEGQPVPAGKTGEIQISGLQLSPDVAGPYRTGDLAFWQNGRLWFVGRKEGWVKVRGHRVSLQELSDELRGVTGVEFAQAVCNTTGRIQVFFFPASSALPLQEHTRQWRLPLSLVPLNHIPLNLHGKVDEKALQHCVALPDPPTDPHEALLVQVASEVLGCPVGPQDDLFARGADSLDVAELSAGFGRRLGCLFPAELLYQHKTIRLVLRHLKPAALDLPAFIPAQIPSTVRPEVAVVGANGFLGIHLLAELQRQHTATMAVVRASSPQAARQRLEQAARFWETPLDFDHVEICTLDSFLADSEMHAHVINAAGQTDLNASMAHLQQSNVHLLASLAAKSLHLHQCSSLSVLGWVWDGDVPPLAREVPPPQDSYSFSKWQAEQWLEQQGNCTLYRLTRCWSREEGGPLPENDLGVQALRRHPEWQVHLDVLPVDVVARALVENLQKPPAGVVHLRSPISPQGKPHPDAAVLNHYTPNDHQRYLQHMWAILQHPESGSGEETLGQLPFASGKPT